MIVLMNSLEDWVTLVCFVVTIVNGCIQNDFNASTARQMMIDTGTHVPVFTLSARSLVQCVDICSRAGQCTTINYNKESKDCVLFNITDSESSSSSSDWVALTLSDMTLHNTKYACETNSCGNGEQCTNANVVGEVCAALEIITM